MKKKTRNNLIYTILILLIAIFSIFGESYFEGNTNIIGKNLNVSDNSLKNVEYSENDLNGETIKIYYFDQTTLNMIQSIKAKIIRHPLITVGI